MTMRRAIVKTCAHLRDSDDPLGYVLGYSCLNDVTARDLQKSDVQFTRAKGFDTFCPIGPHIETQLEPRDVLVLAEVPEPEPGPGHGAAGGAAAGPREPWAVRTSGV